MTLATRCPHCQTAFRLVRDQLLLSGGWVRCGHCGEAFDAAAAQFEFVTPAEPSAEPAAQAAGAAQPEAVPAPAGQPAVAPAAQAFPAQSVEPPAERHPEPAFEPAAQAPAEAPAEAPLEPPVEAAPEPVFAPAAQAAAEALAEPPLEPPAEAAAEPVFEPAAQAAAQTLAEPPAEPPVDAARGRTPGPDEPADGESAPAHADGAPVQPWPEDPENVAAGDRGQTAAHAPWIPGAAAAAVPATHAPGATTAPEASDTAWLTQPPAELAAQGHATDPLDLPVALPGGVDSPDAGVDDNGQTRVEPSFEPGFVRQARRRERWQSPWVRAVLGALALLLLVGGLVQGAWIWRDDMGARWPQLRPLLGAMCRIGGCRLAPPRRPQDLVIDASSMAPDGAARLRLDISLRNRGATSVAYPWLQLSLGAGGDEHRLLARKVIAPIDYLRAQGWSPQDIHRRLLQGLSPGEELRLHLPFAVRAAAASYTVYLFYP